jgi:glucokinase
LFIGIRGLVGGSGAFTLQMWGNLTIRGGAFMETTPLNISVFLCSFEEMGRVSSIMIIWAFSDLPLFLASSSNFARVSGSRRKEYGTGLVSSLIL